MRLRSESSGKNKILITKMPLKHFLKAQGIIDKMQLVQGIRT